MTHTAADLHTSPARGPGAVLIACAIATVLLLVGHPMDGGSPAFADVLRREAAQAVPDAVVHGGFILIMTIELACFAVLALRTGVRRPTVLAAMVFTLVGAGVLSASMIVDGLITPAVAARYVAAPVEKQETARALFVLIGAAIGVLMPMGLAFQGLAALAWGAALAPAPGRVRIVGVIGGVLGVVLLVSAGLSPGAGSPLPMMVGLLAMIAWALSAGVLLFSWPNHQSRVSPAEAARRSPAAAPAA